MRSAVPTGTIIAGFRVESLIGAGAMGTVYLAEDTTRGLAVALKLLAPELARDSRFRQRFLRESQLAAALDHPHAVATLSSGEEDGTLYLAMAYVEGSDLRELLRHDRHLEPNRTLGLLEQIAQALDAAHAAGLVHRDVKPGNILVAGTSPGEQAYLCDFGLARYVSSVGSLTGERGFVGTIDYVSPEQIEGGSIDGRADVYSLGCVLFECLAGARPYDRESDLSVVFAHLNEPPPRLSDVQPDLPRAFDDVFATALAKPPGERYATCGELMQAARRASAGQAAGRRRCRGRRTLLGGAAAVAAAAMAIGVVLISQGTEPTTPAAISASSIEGAHLGLPVGAYERLFGRPSRRGTLKTGHSRLVFDTEKVAIYFKGLTDTAVEITTWNKAYRTAAGVGPCSTVPQLKRAYGNALKPSPFNTIDGRIYAYLVGRNLIFALGGRDPTPGPSKRVKAVALYYGDAPDAEQEDGALPFAAAVALGEPSCS